MYLECWHVVHRVLDPTTNDIISSSLWYPTPPSFSMLHTENRRGPGMPSHVSRIIGGEKVSVCIPSARQY